MWNPIKSLTQAWKASQQRKATFQTALAAIESGDLRLVSDALAGTRLTCNQNRDLLYKAINSDGVGMFVIVLNLTGQKAQDRIYHDNGLDLGYSIYTPLYLAISWNKPNVALYLAEKPEIDINYSGEYHSSHKKEASVYELPLELARKQRSMEKVVSVLATRTADLYRQKAAALDAEALRPG